MTDTVQTKTAGLVLSGGAALGAAHLGVIQSLSKKGFGFDFLSGVSAGAIVAALLACGESAESAWKIIKTAKILRLIFDSSSSHTGLISGEKLLGLFNEVFEDRTFEDTLMPLHIGATDFETGERVSINSGKISDAVRASVGVPVFLEPYRHPELGRLLVDGGLVENLPLLAALEHYRGNRLFAVDVATSLDSLPSSEGRRRSRRHLLTKALVRTVRIMLRSQQRNLPEDDRVIYIRPETGPINALDVFKLDELYQLGLDAGAEVEL